MRRAVAMVTMLVLAVASGDIAAGQAQPAPRPGAGQAGRGRPTAPPAAKPAAPAAATTPQRSPGAGAVIVFETAKGNIEIETYPNEAPKSVEHILGLVKRNFYNGLRVHRVEPGFVVQFGDPLTRDMTKRDRWGTGDSGRAIGVAEMNPKRPHRLGAVALAHSGDPRGADSQIYITLAPTPQLDKGYTVFGQVISGMDVVQKLQVLDVIRRATVKGPAK